LKHFPRKGKTIETVATYVQQSIDEHWRGVWEQHLPEIQQRYQHAGDPAYGLYDQTLFHPLQEELKRAGIVCDPVLPGTFPLSRGLWGPQEESERRFWSVLRQENGEALGTLITRFFLDRTRLRLPRAPQVLTLPDTDATTIAIKVERSAIPGL
jgi:hypothetical protein